MSKQPVRAEILQTALNATLGSRNQSYGDPYPNLLLAARLKALYHEAAKDKYSPAHDDAVDMVLSKIARIATGAVGHVDNYVDGAAYMAIAAECQDASGRNAVAKENKVAGATTLHEAVAAMAALREVGNLGSVALEEQKAGSVILVQDPINAETALPTPPERTVEEHAPIKREPITPMIDADSPAKAFSDGVRVFRLGSLVTFGPKDEALWVIISISNGDFGEFTAQHESSGAQYHGIAKHIHKVVTF